MLMRHKLDRVKENQKANKTQVSMATSQFLALSKDLYSDFIFTTITLLF